jgi:hypothetical protein
MSNVRQLHPHQPDLPTIRRHLETLFAPFRAIDERLQAEIVWSDNVQAGGKPKFSQLFYVSSRGLDMAAAHAARKSLQGLNVYVCPNPRKTTAAQGKRGGAADVQAAAYCFIDTETEGGAALVDACPIPPTFTVTTGTTPHRRVHAYWRLDHVTDDWPAWSDAQKRLQAATEGDPISDAPRIMRLAGTINFPPPHKAARGYVVEPVTLQRPQLAGTVVTRDDIVQTFTAMPRTAASANGNSGGGEHGAEFGYKGKLNLVPRSKDEALMARILAGDKWHINMTRLVAHLNAKGLKPYQIMALAHEITLPGFTVEETRAEMQKALDDAIRKWDQPEAKPVRDEWDEDDDDTPTAGDTPTVGDTYRVLDEAAILSLKPPSWLIKGWLPVNAGASLIGPPGTFKSFIALDMALCVTHDRPWHGHAVRHGPVVYIAGEGAAGLGKRLSAWKTAHGIPAEQKSPLFLIPQTVPLLHENAVEKLLRTIRQTCEAPALVIIDTVARAMAGGDENTAKDMGTLIRSIDAIRETFGCAALGIHHTGKDVSRGARGSNSLLGGVDTEMLVEKLGERSVMLSNTKQKDDEEAKDTVFDMEIVDVVRTETDEDGVVTETKTTSLVPKLPPITDRGVVPERVVKFSKRATSVQQWLNAIVDVSNRLGEDGQKASVMRSQLTAELVTKRAWAKTDVDKQWTDIIGKLVDRGVIDLNDDTVRLTGTKWSFS